MNEVNIRLTHPTFYKILMLYTCGFTALGLTFFFTTPTFNPLGFPYPMVGTFFFVLGVSKIVFLNFYRRLNVVRVLMVLEIFLASGWGGGGVNNMGARLEQSTTFDSVLLASSY